MDLGEIKSNIIKHNESYRIGKPTISDDSYNKLIDKLRELSPYDELLDSVGHLISGDRKSKLPIEMASMNKIKTLNDIKDWCRLKGISGEEVVILTPKYDGLSLCIDEETNESWTRGDGVFGQKSDEHYTYVDNKSTSEYKKCFTYGEIIMSNSKFNDKYSEEFANPRNLVAGLINTKNPSESLIDTDYIKYGIVEKGNTTFKTKYEIIRHLNNSQSVKVPFSLKDISSLTEDYLIDLFKEWSVDYVIDGLIIEINDIKLQNELGRETSSNNPVWARAFKHESFEETAETKVIGLSWNISKYGLLKPVIHIEPVNLDGVVVSNVTGNNARFIKDMGIGIGSIVKVKRSGMVIPLIVEVLETVDWVMPTNENIEWNENGIELYSTVVTDEQKIKSNIAFFEILEADNVGEGIIRQLWDNGYETIKSILSITKKDLVKLDRFGDRKAEKIVDSIKNSITNVDLSKLQHASGLFIGLGSKKLKLLEHFETIPTIKDVTKIDGFALKSANVYINNYVKFNEFLSELPMITITENIEKVIISDDLIGVSFVFSGVRRKDLNEIIESMGGKIVSGVTSKVTYLVVKTKGAGTSKEEKALKLGIKILTVEELEDLL